LLFFEYTFILNIINKYELPVTFCRSISNSLTLENGTTIKPNGLTNEFQFESYVEKSSMQISGPNEIKNNLSSNYDKSKYIYNLYLISLIILPFLNNL